MREDPGSAGSTVSPERGGVIREEQALGSGFRFSQFDCGACH